MSRQPNYFYFSDEELELLLKPLGHSLTRPQNLARTVQKLSDFYIAKPDASTPWQDPYVQVAYLVYYLPLGLMRWRAVYDEALRADFFSGLQSLVDFGSGPGTAALVFGEAFHRETVTAVERAREASEFHRRIFERWGRPKSARMNFVTDTKIPVAPSARDSLLVLSYVLTELEIPPAEILSYDSVVVMEPSTHQDGRRLMEWREMWKSHGYHLWAPCTHQAACPLLIHSKKDWCHDRVIWERPDWWLQMENHLPFKNKSITFSYLMMSRRKPPARPAGIARLVGDTLSEKGKTRQMVCRGPEREFLSWLTKNGPAPDYGRGELIELTDVEIKGAELRAETFAWPAKR